MKKDLNKKLTTKELEVFVKKQEQLESKSGRDNIIVWSLLLIGIAGLFTVIRSNDTIFSNSKNERISEEKIQSSNAQFAEARVAFPILNQKSNNTIVSIKGIKEAAEVVTFEVEGFQKNANYKFDFGDGMERTLTHNIVKHVYRDPGNYNVKLIVSYKNETKVLFSKSITIEESIEVPEGALFEMRR